jgi:hypothetical protein
MQEREELRALKREMKMSREGNVKRKICVWKRKKEKYKSNIYICLYERMKESDRKKKKK